MTQTTHIDTTEFNERIANDDSKLHATFSVGDCSCQGDIIFIAIAELTKSARRRERRQIAEGETQGSRHVVERGDVYDADLKEVANAILAATGRDIEWSHIGPIFVSPVDPTADDVTHPEHGNQGFPSGTVIAVAFQRNLDAEEREVRTRD